ncbi:HPr kinase/phosphorylase [Altererythrobacter insulae]|nr:HPr kinase/phosphorylase [Altererythrobacter insulae]
MSAPEALIGVTAVSIGGRAILFEGAPGSGKSSLALALIDRGAVLVGDDGVTIADAGGQLVLSPPPNISGKLEVRGVGIVEVDATSAPLALILALDPDAPRYPETKATRTIRGCRVPVLPFRAGDAAQALRAEWALRIHGLSL